MTERREIQSLEDLRNLAQEIASQRGSRLLLLLEGPMGAGKTQFTRFLVEALGSGETASPSFAIHHNYASAQTSIDHFDLFRLESVDDLESTGFWDFFRAKEGVIVIEWADRLDEFGIADQLPFPGAWLRIRMRFSFGASGEQRLIEIERV
mgnify:CR=1 FL=1